MRSIALVAASMLVAATVPNRADASATAASSDDTNKPSFAIVPGPFYNPNQGLGLFLIPMMVFHPNRADTVSPPSLLAIGGMYAVLPPLDDAKTRFSWAAAAGTRLYLGQDKWRLVGLAAYFDLFRKFNGIGGRISHNALFEYRQLGAIIAVQAMRELGVRHLYAGLILGYTTYRTSTTDPAKQEIIDSLGTGSTWKGQPVYGLAAQFDNRDSQYYPSSGLNINVRATGSAQSDQKFFVVLPTLAQYFPLLRDQRLVLAYKLFGQFGWGDLPLANHAYYGSRGTTLGYESGDYIDKMLAGVEAELRWLFFWRFGLEGGGGVGKVFPSFNEFGSQPWLPGAWASLTYKVIAKEDIRARVTFAVGKDDVAYYFSIGQVF